MLVFIQINLGKSKESSLLSQTTNTTLIESFHLRCHTFRFCLTEQDFGSFLFWTLALKGWNVAVSKLSSFLYSQVWFSNHRSKDKRKPTSEKRVENRSPLSVPLSASRIFMPTYQPVPVIRYGVYPPAFSNYAYVPYWKAAGSYTTCSSRDEQWRQYTELLRQSNSVTAWQKYFPRNYSVLSCKTIFFSHHVFRLYLVFSVEHTCNILWKKTT